MSIQCIHHKNATNKRVLSRKMCMRQQQRLFWPWYLNRTANEFNKMAKRRRKNARTFRECFVVVAVLFGFYFIRRNCTRTPITRFTTLSMHDCIGCVRSNRWEDGTLHLIAATSKQKMLQQQWKWFLYSIIAKFVFAHFLSRIGPMSTRTHTIVHWGTEASIYFMDFL